MRTCSLAAALMLGLLLPVAGAQEIASLMPTELPRGAVAQAADFTIRRTVGEVHLIFAVLDQHGRPVPNLTRDDFAIVDDRTAVEAVTDFRSQADLPLRLGLLVDVSGSVERRFAQQQEAAVAFLTRLMRPTDKAFAAAFDSKVVIPQTLSSEKNDLAATIGAMRNTGRLTAVYDALLKATRRLEELHELTPIRRALVLVSDGEDTISLHSFHEAVAAAQRADITVYAIGMRTRRKSDGGQVLCELAVATGGRAFFPAHVSELAMIFAQINDELRTHYLVGYHPPLLAADGRFHRVEITTARGRKLQVRARAGYFAPDPESGVFRGEH